MLKIKIFISNSLLYIQNFVLSSIQKIFWFRNPVNISNILVYKVGNIGDLATAYPAIKIIRYKFPNAKITLLTSTGDSKRIKTKNWKKGVSGASIFKNQNILDDILYYEKLEFKSITKLIKKIRKKNFDRAFVMSASGTSFLREFRNLLFFKLLKINHVSGFNISLPSIFKKSFSLQKPYLLINEVDRNINNLDLGITFNKSFFDYKFPEINNNLKSEINHLKNILVVALGSKFQNRKWNRNKFESIAERWLEEIGDVIFIGGKGDYEDSNTIIENLKTYNFNNKSINFCGKTSIGESIYLINQSKAMIANCSGPAHLASFTSTKVVTIQSSYNFAKIWGSYFSTKYVLRPSFEISGKDIQNCKSINEIEVIEAWTSLNKIINL